jgi:hypothetical protein
MANPSPHYMHDKPAQPITQGPTTVLLVSGNILQDSMAASGSKDT